MSLSDEIQKLTQLRDAGALTPEEFEIAKRKVLEGTSDTATGEEHLAEIKAQNELARLDREWQIEREKYMVNGRYGGRHVPNAAGSVIGGIVIAVFGTFWTAMAFAMTGMGGAMAGGFDNSPLGFISCFPLFGILFIALGVGNAFWSFNKATQYQEAETKYQRRRREWLSKQGRE